MLRDSALFINTNFIARIRITMVTFSHTIFYVKDVPKALAFYKDAFGLEPKFIHESNQYAELATGSTALAFASDQLAAYNLPKGYVPHDISKVPLACEIALSVSDVQAWYERALRAGAHSIAAPQQKPWGQVVAYVQDPNGVLVEIAGPLSS